MKSKSDQDARIQRIEKGLPPLSLAGTELPIGLTLQKLMQLYKVPGLSIAVIDNFEIAWAKGYGVTEAGTSNPVTPLSGDGRRGLVEHTFRSRPVCY